MAAVDPKRQSRLFVSRWVAVILGSPRHALGCVAGARCRGIGGGTKSGHPEISHHSGFLMFDDMAVEHPVAWVVGDESNFRRLFW
jgi:hypothetical protein